MLRYVAGPQTMAADNAAECGALCGRVDMVRVRAALRDVGTAGREAHNTTSPGLSADCFYSL